MKCVAGCNFFDGGEVKHHPDCPYYPESLSKMMDDIIQKNEALKQRLENNHNDTAVSLSFDDLQNAVLNHKAKSEYKQATIVILRHIFEERQG